MTEITVGIKHVRDEVEVLPTYASNMSVVGIIGTAEDADEDIFPLDKPIYAVSSDAVKIAALGADGTLKDAIAGVSAQSLTQAVEIVVVRVAEGASVAETIANIVGSEGDGTGIWAFIDAPEELGVTPRLIIAPGYTSQFRNKGVLSIPITSGGSAYASGTIAFAGGGGSGATAHPVFTGGVLTSIVIDDPGNGYTSAPTATFTGVTGTGAVIGAVAIGVLANAVVTAIPAVLGRLNAVFLPEGPATTYAAWLAYRETIQSDRVLHPLSQDAKVTDADGAIVTRPLSPFIIGIYVRRDADNSGRPFRSIANQPIYGIVGISRPIPFSYTDGALEGQTILANNGGIVVKGEAGVESSVGTGGFVFWGTDTCSEDPLWLFAHVVRGRDYIELGQLRTLRYYLGRFNITVATVNAILNTMSSELQLLKNYGDILDFRRGLDPDVNSPELLRQGFIHVFFRAEEAPVLRKITISSRRYREALTRLLEGIAVSLGSSAS